MAYLSTSDAVYYLRSVIKEGIPLQENYLSKKRDDDPELHELIRGLPWHKLCEKAGYRICGGSNFGRVTDEGIVQESKRIMGLFNLAYVSPIVYERFSNFGVAPVIGYDPLKGTGLTSERRNKDLVLNSFRRMHGTDPTFHLLENNKADGLFSLLTAPEYVESFTDKFFRSSHNLPYYNGNGWVVPKKDVYMPGISSTAWKYMCYGSGTKLPESITNLVYGTEVQKGAIKKLTPKIDRIIELGYKVDEEPENYIVYADRLMGRLDSVQISNVWKTQEEVFEEYLRNTNLNVDTDAVLKRLETAPNHLTLEDYELLDA